MSTRIRKISNMCDFDVLIRQMNMEALPEPTPGSADTTASSEGFPSPPPPIEFFPPPPGSITPPLEDPPKSAGIMAKTLSFDNPLANLSATDTKNGAGGSDDENDFDFTDADAAIDKMLDDLQDFQDFLGPDTQQEKKEEFGMLSPSKENAVPPPISNDSLDHLRFSMGNFEETPEVDLDALLEDLCVMERDIKESSVATLRRKGYNISESDPTFNSPHSPSPPPTITGDEDIAQFMPNSPSYKATSPVMVTHDVKERLENLQNEMESKEITPEEQEARIKAEKMKIALEKMKAASFQKLFIKVLNKEKETSKTMMVDQTWTARDVTQKMVSKDDVEIGPNWCILEKLPDLDMERIMEDHEYVLNTVLDWSRETENMLVFANRRDKYLLFKNPQNYLLSNLHSEEDAKLAEKSKDLLLEEFFTKDNTQIPQIEGVLSIRKGTKKWEKHYVVLRASGIYYNAKGKQKTRELSCLVQFEHNNIYLGVRFKKKYKAPTDHVICLKHPKVQNISSKHIFCLCADDSKTMYHWLTAIRMAKYGYSMYEDYMTTQQQVESVLLAGSRTTVASSVASSNDNINKASTLDKKSKNATVRGTVRNQVKNTEGNVDRVKGKQNSLADVFSNAWSKGMAEMEACEVPDTPFSPMSPMSPSSPGTPHIRSPVKTFDYANSASSASVNTTTHGTTGQSLTLDPVPPGRRASQKSRESTVSVVSDDGSFCSFDSFSDSSSLGDDLPPAPPNIPYSASDTSLSDMPPPPPDDDALSPPPPPDVGIPPPPPPPPPPLGSKSNQPPAPPPPPPLSSKPGHAPPPPPPPLGAKPGR